MLTLLVILAILAVLFGAAVVATQDNQVLADAPPDDHDVELPSGRVVAEDLRAVRFGMVLRGYRMSEVDAVLARLGEELAVRDERLADLERVLAEIVAPVVDEVEEAASREPAPPPPPVPTAPVVPDEPPAAPAAIAGEARAEAPPVVADEPLATDEAPGEVAAQPAAEELSPAAAFTLPGEAHSLRMPLVEQELEATPETDLEPVVDLAVEAPPPELDGEPETEAEIVDEPPARAPAEAEDAREAAAAEPERTEAGVADLAAQPPLPLAVDEAGARPLPEEPEAAEAPVGEGEVVREAAVQDEAFRGTAAEALVPPADEGVTPDRSTAAPDDFAFPEVLGADEAQPGLPDAVEDSERDADVWRRPEDRGTEDGLPEDRRPGPPEPA